MFTLNPTLDHVTLLPSGFDLTAPDQPTVRRYAAEVQDLETGDTCLVANLLTIAGPGEADLACELAGNFGQVLQVWPMDQPRPGTVQTRTYDVLIERAAIDPEVGPVMEVTTVSVTIPAGFLSSQGGGEIARLHVQLARTMPGWSVVNMAPADADAEEF